MFEKTIESMNYTTYGHVVTSIKIVLVLQFFWWTFGTSLKGFEKMDSMDLTHIPLLLCQNWNLL